MCLTGNLIQGGGDQHGYKISSGAESSHLNRAVLKDGKQLNPVTEDGSLFQKDEPEKEKLVLQRLIRGLGVMKWLRRFE